MLEDELRRVAVTPLLDDEVAESLEGIWDEVQFARPRPSNRSLMDQISSDLSIG